MQGFDAIAFTHRMAGHGAALGIVHHAHGDDWAELALPFDAAQVGDPLSGTIASGPVVTLVDIAASIAVWLRRGRFEAHATLDLRIDHLRAAAPGRTVIGRGECYRLSRSVAFVRGLAHDGDPGDPIVHMVGTYMRTGVQTGMQADMRMSRP